MRLSHVIEVLLHDLELERRKVDDFGKDGIFRLRIGRRQEVEDAPEVVHGLTSTSLTLNR